MGEGWEIGHNFGETVRFWVFARRKGLHVQVSVHTDLHCPFKFHLPQGPQGCLAVAALDFQTAFLQVTHNCYPPILSDTCIHVLIMIINVPLGDTKKLIKNTVARASEDFEMQKLTFRTHSETQDFHGKSEC